MSTPRLAALLSLLDAHQKKMLQLSAKHAKYFNIQYHADLSPMGWHLGHCVYTETFWIREQLLKLLPTDQTLRTYYTPELTKKQQRGATLPDYYSSLHQWSYNTQQENLHLLQQYQDTDEHPLMRHHFLLHFLIQHYAQHLETMHMILLQKALQADTHFVVTQPLTEKKVNADTATVHASDYTVGATAELLPYDNEYPAHTFNTDTFKITKKPVNNGEFLSFMKDAGYQTEQYWSKQGWQWQQQHNIAHPLCWRHDDHGKWFGVNVEGPHHLLEEYPISGINYFEAQAFATWAGGNLPHEHEWEIAMQNGHLQNTGHAWEWCYNRFYPYSDESAHNRQFQAFPYSGYSEPYFDGQHFVMRGSSQYTQSIIKRHTFRNYYRADKRHQFAGCRIVFH